MRPAAAEPWAAASWAPARPLLRLLGAVALLRAAGAGRNCTAPPEGSIEFAGDPTCREGYVIDVGGICTPVCVPGSILNLSVDVLRCIDPADETSGGANASNDSNDSPNATSVNGSNESDGSNESNASNASNATGPPMFVPPNFTCSPLPCHAPTGFEHSAAETCGRSGPILHGEECQATCATGYTPEPRSLGCALGNLTPHTFTCSPSPCQGLDVPNKWGSGCHRDPTPHETVCLTQCAHGYEPSVDELSCSFGVFSPPSFECRGLPCIAPAVERAGPGHAACVQGATIAHGGICTPLCAPGYNATVAVNLTCSATVLTPGGFDCVPSGCFAPLTFSNSSAQTCAEGPLIQHGGSCTLQCRTNYHPSVPRLGCSFGALAASSSGYACEPDPCAAPEGIPNAAEVSCADGPLVNQSGMCHTVCQPGYVPSVAALTCDAGRLSPPNFNCAGLPCAPPANGSVANAEEATCAESPGGENISHLANCTPRCLAGYRPLPPSLGCAAQALRPSIFACLEEALLEGATPMDGTDVVLQSIAWHTATAPLRDGAALVCHVDVEGRAIDAEGRHVGWQARRRGRCRVLVGSTAAMWMGPSLLAADVEDVAGLRLAPLGAGAVLCYHDEDYEPATGRAACRELGADGAVATLQGAEVAVSPSATRHLSLTALGPSDAVLCYQRSNVACACRVLEPSPLTAGPESATLGAEDGGAVAVALQLAVAPLGAGRALACLADALRGRRAFCQILARVPGPGQTLALHASVNVTAGAATHLAMAPLGADRALLCFADWAGEEHGHCRVLSAAAHGVSVDASLVFADGLTRYVSLAALAPAAVGRVLVCYQFSPALRQQPGHCRLLTALESEAPSVSAPAVLNEGITWEFALASLWNDTVVACFSDTSDHEWGKCRTVWGPRLWQQGEAHVCRSGFCTAV